VLGAGELLSERMMFTSPQPGHVTRWPMIGFGTSMGFSQRSQVMVGIGGSWWSPCLIRRARVGVSDGEE
jgi:hypothetical protein